MLLEKVKTSKKLSLTPNLPFVLPPHFFIFRNLQFQNEKNPLLENDGRKIVLLSRTKNSPHFEGGDRKQIQAKR